MEDVELTRIAGTCNRDDCPTLYRTNRGTLAIQGDHLSGRRTPDGEAIVEIPEELLREAVRALGW
ncbi:hypothetical protein [Actinomadura rupiterrae]|uniref:hypothetical protein n=1 Tax=Actinomadura rupiterrae TaxID=559627 RepID=UPI0027E32172|nr:hypothetical protein [Actinomadura rupiterrae]MCP2334813.1 hypothetical protein [Actinomadura rupiterrae]